MTSARAFSRRFIASFVLAAALVGSTAVTIPHDVRAGSYSFSWVERCFMTKINTSRARHGRAKLRRDPQVGYVARRFARTMARNRAIWHDPRLGRKVTRWLALGQNAGRGGGCKRLFRAFMRSPGHRANILGRWRHMGIGAAWRNGTLYVQQVFERRRDPGNVWGYPSG